MRTATKERRLAELAVLHDLPRRVVRQVARHADEVRLAPGTVLMRQDGRSTAAYLLVEGFLDVEVDDRRVAVLRPGDVAGEMGVLDLHPRTATVVAATDVVVYEIPARNFTALVALSPDLRERMRHAA